MYHDCHELFVLTFCSPTGYFNWRMNDQILLLKLENMMFVRELWSFI